MQTRRSNRIYFQEEEAVLYINKNIYCINKDSIRKLGSKVNLCCPFTVNLQNVRQIMKSGSSWWLMSEKMLIMVTPTQREQLSMNIGMRVGQPCGKISCCSVYPIKSLLGSVTSVLIGFENGPVLKYNYNLNRLTSRQTNLTHYKPLLEQVRSGQ